MTTDMYYKCKRAIGRIALPADLITNYINPKIYLGDTGFIAANNETLDALKHLVKIGDVRTVKGSIAVSDADIHVIKYELTRRGRESIA